jgi:hypothetical protein
VPAAERSVIVRQTAAMPYDDDDDWVGTPPEGRISRDRANPGYWRRSFPAVQIFFALLAVGVIVVLVLALA